MNVSHNNRNRSILIGNSVVFFGRFSYGTENLLIRQWNEGAKLKIGSFCSLADNITIFLGGNHRKDWISTFPFGHIYQEEIDVPRVAGSVQSNGDVTIGNDVWIGSNATIMSGVTVGSGAIIAANAHVTKDVAPYCIYGGNPARLIKERFNTEISELLLKLAWWELPLEDIKNISKILSSKATISKVSELISFYRT